MLQLVMPAPRSQTGLAIQFDVNIEVVLCSTEDTRQVHGVQLLQLASACSALLYA